ncbi:MAG: DUF3429 domain-containing protein [Gammaproteobacteria bacterium]
MPAVAAWLGGLGALPFVALALLMAVGPAGFATSAAPALVAYGAVILSFLGGIQWGLAVAVPRAGAALRPARLVVSVLPSLVGWIALLLPTPAAAMVVLAVAFLAVLVVDTRAWQRGETPPWYPRLRWPLTLVVGACLLLAAGA